jgi:hypothetical protein
LVVVTVVALTLIVYVPWRAIDKYHHFRGMRPDIRTLSAVHAFGRSLVFVRGKEHPDYASAAVYNPLDWHAGAPVYAWYRDSEAVRQAVAAYPDRPVWLIDGPTMTGGGFEVAAGPLAPGTIPQMPLWTSGASEGGTAR